MRKSPLEKEQGFSKSPFEEPAPLRRGGKGDVKIELIN